ncbi:MAG: DUF1761 domain-containing protein [Bdellovibrionota bacterium]
MKRINFKAVLVVVLFQQLLGFIWYSPALFGNPWLIARGKNPAFFVPTTYYWPFVFAAVSSFLFACVVSVALDRAKVKTFKKGVKVGGMLWSAFIFPVILTNYSFLGLSRELKLIDGGMLLISYAVGAGIIGAWKKK